MTWANENNMIASISIGPGYNDLRIRPWNKANMIPRNNGAYYDDRWDVAVKADPHFISITSYNEWMEGIPVLIILIAGTQIEASIPMKTEKSIYPEVGQNGYVYSDYRPHLPTYYLDQTSKHALTWCVINKKSVAL